MIKIDIKPLSVNEAWKGRRFKSDKYKEYENALMYMLPRKYTIPEGDLQITFKFGFSSPLSDWDNGIKTTQDILQKKYGFDDRRIFEGRVKKEIVKKGKEYVEFEITSLNENEIDMDEEQTDLIRKKLWADVFAAASSSEGVNQAASWADEALRDFDTRFKTE